MKVRTRLSTKNLHSFRSGPDPVRNSCSHRNAAQAMKSFDFHLPHRNSLILLTLPHRGKRCFHLWICPMLKSSVSTCFASFCTL